MTDIASAIAASNIPLSDHSRIRDVLGVTLRGFAFDRAIRDAGRIRRAGLPGWIEFDLTPDVPPAKATYPRDNYTRGIRCNARAARHAEAAR